MPKPIALSNYPPANSSAIRPMAQMSQPSAAVLLAIAEAGTGMYVFGLLLSKSSQTSNFI